MTTAEHTAAALEAVPIDQRAVEVAYRVFNAPHIDWPYPHKIIDELLARDLFEGLRDLDLDEASLEARTHIEGVAAAERFRHSISVTPADVDSNQALPSLVRYAYKVLSHPLSMKALTRVFARDLMAAFGRLDLPLASTLMLVEDRSGYALLPHTDVPHKAVTLLIYLAGDGADPSLGTELYMPAPGVTLEGGFPMRGRFARSPFVRVATAPYRGNLALMFPPSQRSFHGVKEVTAGDPTRRLLQFQISVDDPEMRRVDDLGAAERERY